MLYDRFNWILIEGHQRNISAKLYWKKICPVVSDKNIFKVFYIAIQGKEAPPLAAMYFNKSWQFEQTW